MHCTCCCQTIDNHFLGDSRKVSTRLKLERHNLQKFLYGETWHESNLKRNNHPLNRHIYKESALRTNFEVLVMSPCVLCHLFPGLHETLASSCYRDYFPHHLLENCFINHINLAIFHPFHATVSTVVYITAFTTRAHCHLGIIKLIRFALPSFALTTSISLLQLIVNPL